MKARDFPGRGSQLNVLGGPLLTCSDRPLTGFFRDGCCNTSEEDIGSHTVCVVLTAEFLEFSKARGNDLSTPHPEFDFPGLLPGQRWCLCAARWLEAGVLVLPGNGLGAQGEGFVRLALIWNEDILAEAMDRLARTTL